MQVHAFGQSSEGHFEHNGSTGTRRRGDDIGRDFAGGRHGTTDEIFHDKYITCLLPIPDMKLIASAGRDKKMCLWEMETLKGKSVHAGPHGHTMAINSLEWYEDSRLILSAGMDHDIFIWNPIVKERIFKL